MLPGPDRRQCHRCLTLYQRPDCDRSDRGLPDRLPGRRQQFDLAEPEQLPGPGWPDFRSRNRRRRSEQSHISDGHTSGQCNCRRCFLGNRLRPGGHAPLLQRASGSKHDLTHSRQHQDLSANPQWRDLYPLPGHPGTRADVVAQRKRRPHDPAALTRRLDLHRGKGQSWAGLQRIG